MIDIAVIGCGYWGPNLIRNFRALEQAKVKVVCDKDWNRLRDAVDSFSGTKSAARNTVQQPTVNTSANRRIVHGHILHLPEPIHW